MTASHDLTAAGAPAFDATTDYWQEIVSAETLALPVDPPYSRGYPARLPDGRYLVLPLRAVPGDPQRCVASLIANHASLEVVDALAGFMAERARAFQAEVVVGLPTLGLAFAPLVARGLGFTRYVPFGYSRKYWYDERLAVPVKSLTTPDTGKLLYVDPNLAQSLAGRRVLVVDDAVSTGQTMLSALELLARCGAEVAGIVVAMCQGTRWRERLMRADGTPIPVACAFESPRMRRTPGGWVPEAAA
ncbi:phosphoribosyltransferase [Achromobacter insolitus]|jgi:adenine/guanine phosphoribosyltransferase-like PRPP-binding protein|nr:MULTISPECIES: phosphoribosyltransferase [Achromobacter]AVG41879.1 phosphoribosyltransferase [Achromobacter insolitus]MCP1400652.1 adenine/guanine phosphoribosyltransferase-like PRPP-binding protein [Achromobacter insolitus]MDH3061975.1 phosphoribosyltransferase [Achromobacter insolitus]MEB3095057.1 phosphoribosyltransferase [Achromobacter sp. D10]OAD17575.1 phosphoribosyltransferase [Achromobacter insolitus]